MFDICTIQQQRYSKTMKSQTLKQQTTLKSGIDLLSIDDFNFEFRSHDMTCYASHEEIMCYIILDYSSEKFEYDKDDERITQDLLDELFDIMITYKEDHEYELNRWSEDYHPYNQAI